MVLAARLVLILSSVIGRFCPSIVSQIGLLEVVFVLDKSFVRYRYLLTSVKRRLFEFKPRNPEAVPNALTVKPNIGDEHPTNKRTRFES